MKETIKSYLAQYYPLRDLFGKVQDADDQITFNKYKLGGFKRVFLHLLKVSPYICGVLFIASFSISTIYPLIPYPGLATFYESNAIIFEAILTVAVSGLIGYGTNYVAIRMLFRPVEPRPIWGQGLIPAQRDRIIVTLAKGIHKHILNQELIRRRVEESGLVTRLNEMLVNGTGGILRDESLRRAIKNFVYDALLDYSQQERIRQEIYQIIDTRLEKNLEGGVKRFLLQTYKRYNKDDYEDIIRKIVEDIPKIAMDVMDNFEEELNRLAAYVRTQKSISEDFLMKVFVSTINRLDITGLLYKQMEHFDESRLERMVWEATNEQLLYIQYLGTLLGILGGLLIWKTQIMIVVFIIVFGLLYFLDLAIVRFKSKS